MQEFSYTPHGVCPRQISFGMEEGKLHHVSFLGGCPGNTRAIGKLLEGTDARKAVDLLLGNDCGGRGTSCADQLAIAIDQALKLTEETAEAEAKEETAAAKAAEETAAAEAAEETAGAEATEDHKDLAEESEEAVYNE